MRAQGATSLAAVVGLCSLVLALSLGASSAGAVVAKIRGHGYGVTPIAGANPASIAGMQHAQAPPASSPAGAPRNFDGAPKGGGPLLYEGGPVMHSDNTHVIYWDPNSEFTATTKGIVGSFLTNVAHDSGLASNVFAVAGQYTDSTGNAAYNSTFGGALTDANAYPTSGCAVPKTAFSDPGPYTECLFDEQLQQQLTTFIAEDKLPVGPTQLYFVLLPHKVATCLEEEEEGEQVCSNNFFCAYHSAIHPGTASEIVYADIPFSLLDSADAKGCQDDGNPGIQQPNPDNAGGSDTETRFADVALKYISHEYIEATTDPQLNAWFDANGLEIGDKCNGVTPDEKEDGIGYDKNAFLPTLGGSAGSDDLFNQSIDTGSYYLQSEWDNAAKACLTKPLALSAAEFTPSPASTIVGSVVNFAGSATDPYGELGFAWTFGDGSTGAGSSPSHTYEAPGSYTVRMTPKDALTGSTATPVEHTVTVSKSPQTIAITSATPGSATVGRIPYTVAATASSRLPVSFSSATPSVCSVSGSTVSFLAAGTCTIDADQPGSEEYEPAAQVQQSFTVAGEPVVTSFQIPRLPSELTSGGGQIAVVTTAPNSNFSIANTRVNPATGAIAFTASVSDPGAFSWLLAFQNGKFGAFASTASTKAKCKAGFVVLTGKCRPAKILYARGGQTFAAAGTVKFTVKLSASAKKALANALKKGRGLPVTAILTFQSSLGGAPVSHTRPIVVKLSRAGRKGKR